MVEENNDIFLAGGDALVYSAEPIHKNYSTTFVWDHPFSMHVSYDQFFKPLPPVRTCTHFGWLLSIPPVAYIFNKWPISQPQKQIRTFKYRIYWNINIRKKILYEKINGSVGWNKDSGEQY